MSKTNKILIALVVLLVLILAGVVLWQTAFKTKSYHAVFLRTGDLYFGELVRFPYFGLRNVYTIQINAQNQENPISIQRFRNVFWGPEDWLKINRDEVVWLTKLNPQGQLAGLIRTNPDLLPPAGAPNPEGAEGQ